GKVPMPTSVLELARKDFVAERTLETIKAFYQPSSSSAIPYIADPHTSVALHAAGKFAAHNSQDTVQIVLSTAHPAKFSEAVTKALSSLPWFDFEGQVLPPEFKGLLNLPRRVIEVERPDPELVKRVIEKVVTRDEAKLGTQALS
ncbi:7046_t:CDS:2, partial [Acaulospora colombiana]